MKTRILHVIHSLQIGGLENGVVNLINNIEGDRFDHAVCCIDSSGPMAERIRRPVEIYSLGKSGKKDYMIPLKIAKIINKARPDIVHTRNWGAIDGVIGARLAGVRHIIHGEHGREATDPTGANKRRLRIRKLLHPLVARFVTVSTDLKNWLMHDVGVPEGKVIQIINGVDMERFKPAPNKAGAKKLLGLAPDSFVVGTIGRLDPVKDQRTLIRAFAEFTTNKAGKTDITAVTGMTSSAIKTNETSRTIETNNTNLLIVGPGPEESNLRKLARDLGIADRVYFMGERRDVREVLQAMDIFALPSIAEGISNTILEAMASGLPVVATNVGGNAELVVDGETGALFESGDYVHLSVLLGEYATAPKIVDAQGRSARERVEKRFSLSRMTKEYERLYHSVLDV